MKTKHILHLYNRIGFGITSKEINRIKHLSRKEIVEELFVSSKETSPLSIDVTFANNVRWKDLRDDRKKREAFKRKSKKKVRAFNGIWLQRIFNPTELLREKMTLFWANHFVCENKRIIHVLNYNNTLRKHALGNFGDFTKAVSKEAAMLNYLNNKQNKKNKPNENFARELMELFMLGEGNYTEKDIKESARAFTGYNHEFKGGFKLIKKHQDIGEKTFFGKQGAFNGDDIIDIILRKEQCARFICEKLYTYFVNDNINDFNIKEMVDVFYVDYNIETVMKYILLSDWFYDEINIGSKIKSPIELLAGIHKIVPFKIIKPSQEILIQKLLNQVLLYPPNVAGWKQGKGWIDTNTLVTRLRLPSVLLNNAEINYSEKGDFKDIVEDFNKKLQKKAFITTTTKWDVFEKNYAKLTHSELTNLLLISPISSGTKQLIKQNNALPIKDFCIQLLSLPEYQLC